MLDFSKAKKRFMQIKMIDGKNILVRMPTKKIFEKLMDMESLMKSLDIDNLGAVDQIYIIASEILSNNMKGEQIPVEYLSELMDIEDITMLMESYIGFCTGQAASPNSESLPSLNQEKKEGSDTDAQQNGND